MAFQVLPPVVLESIDLARRDDRCPDDFDSTLEEAGSAFNKGCEVAQQAQSASAEAYAAAKRISAHNESVLKQWVWSRPAGWHTYQNETERYCGYCVWDEDSRLWTPHGERERWTARGEYFCGQVSNGQMDGLHVWNHRESQRVWQGRWNMAALSGLVEHCAPQHGYRCLGLWQYVGDGFILNCGLTIFADGSTYQGYCGLSSQHGDLAASGFGGWICPKRDIYVLGYFEEGWAEGTARVSKQSTGELYAGVFTRGVLRSLHEVAKCDT